MLWVGGVVKICLCDRFLNTLVIGVCSKAEQCIDLEQENGAMAGLLLGLCWRAYVGIIVVYLLLNNKRILCKYDLQIY